MNLFKSSLLSLLVSFSLFTPSLSFAVAETPLAKPVTNIQADSSSLVATVNIEQPRILSQNGNSFNIAFSISNREGLQSGAKYGVELIPDGAKYIADEKVYDETLTLYENSTIKREVVYVAPSTLGGSYTLYLVSNNESGFPFAIASLGKVKLLATTKGVNILNDSCYLQVEGEKGSPHYSLTQSVDINNSSELLRLTCSAVNQTEKNLSLTPFFETRYYSPYGNIAPQTGGNYTAISFAKGEKKTFSMILPKGSASGFYNLKVALMGADLSSNNIAVHYIIDGVNASIQKVSLDKDYYKFGDNGSLSILWSASSGNFARSGIKAGGAPAVSLKATITGKNGAECASPISQDLAINKNNPQTQIPFKTKATCVDPKVSATLADKDGKTLDQKTFTFTTSVDHNPKPLKSVYLIIGIIVLFIIVGFGIVMRKKKDVTM